MRILKDSKVKDSREADEDGRLYLQEERVPILSVTVLYCKYLPQYKHKLTPTLIPVIPYPRVTYQVNEEVIR